MSVVAGGDHVVFWADVSPRRVDVSRLVGWSGIHVEVERGVFCFSICSEHMFTLSLDVLSLRVPHLDG